MERPGTAAFAFGAPKHLLSNQRIGLMVGQMANEYGAPAHIQRDIPVDYGVDVTYTEEIAGNPPPTLRIARSAVSWALRRDRSEIWIACAKPHLWRCKRDLLYAIEEARVMLNVRVCPEVELWPEEEWYCPESILTCARSRKAWRQRERILEWTPMPLYDFITS
jgi:hypothetical protein